ncbi:MAG: SUMF1/EgtB/PvdO family nonheme iron enzyme [bacterium]|nr:SUMF1/EgtB/PvdO family nonheme iron enzyme [bacterium]
MNCPWKKLLRAWERSDQIMSCVAESALQSRPIGLRHPLAFYVGHLPAFAVNLLLVDLLGRRTPSPKLDRLFAFGIDPDEGEAVEELVLPELPAIEDYRDNARAALREAAAEVLAAPGGGGADSGRERMFMVLEHELMHHETLLYLLQEMPVEDKVASALTEVVGGSAVRLGELVEIPGGEVTLGCAAGDRDFVWDNEVGRHTIQVPAFRVQSAPVTIGEYSAFVCSGGYDNESLWTPEGWRWKQTRGIRHPKDWTSHHSDSRVRSLFETHALSDVSGWPVCVSWAEADAYCRSKGGRLPTEAELARAAYTTPGNVEREYPWGDDERMVRGLAFGAHGPLPVGADEQGDSAWGVAELLGNGWDWTSTLFAPYPGFAAYPHYPGYSADFFDGKHYCLFGGSWATDRQLTRRTFRNWYRFNYPYPFTKFRIAWDV